MTTDEWKVLAKAIKAAYPNSNIFPDKESVQVWYMLLKDIPYEVLNAAVQKYALTNKFPPSVADLRELCVETTGNKVSDWGMGWQSVMEAVRKYGWPNKQKALESLDDITRACVERLGWMDICQCTSDDMMALRANFRKMYELLEQEKKNELQLTDGLKAQLAILSSKQNLIEGEA